MQGKTYGEINLALNIKLAKSTLHCICKHTPLPAEYLNRITKLNIQNLGLARATAAVMNKVKKEKLLKEIKEINAPISSKIFDKDTAKIALAMLCLGEASKSDRGSSFSFGNSDPKIIKMFIDLLKYCFDFYPDKIRGRVQYRADQDPDKLRRYWSHITGIPQKQFTKAYMDKRTIGKPTLRPNYKGVLRIDYFQRKIQFELESLADLIYNQLQLGPVV